MTGKNGAVKKPRIRITTPPDQNVRDAIEIALTELEEEQERLIRKIRDSIKP